MRLLTFGLFQIDFDCTMTQLDGTFKEEGKLNMYTTRVRFVAQLIVSARFRRVTFRVLFIGFNM